MESAKVEIRKILEQVLAPLVEADGGKLYVLRLEDDAVEIHLAGRFSGCPGNEVVARRIIGPAISAVAPDAVCIVTSGALVPEGATRVHPVG
jgi:Fe-S cluster biogenesis protein NfuA